ncbi:DNA/RNA non-specific endonuclease [Homoserinibacter sp. YIM 151385]|uniref:DNA/RNA non-specific endonuclease n=1 Tax=Homoserinibacter sp. YIM 151385 TaxID=2985506 RepID=UPI0022F12D67|nr:DNA/RNA non-specific endonuclease [Homoserinibacter sp. YIM 151385]WBU39307.1 DNA/RNA non-specific endonuclease [Homoserinibacter sp. YIM 151385]
MTTGYDPAFLGLEVPPPAAARALTTLDYTHFAVAMDPLRRLAAWTAVAIDGAALRDVPRGGDDWRLDDRIPETEQAGPELYARNDLDRGHLVRRRDPVWGEEAVAARANADTFHYTNAAPQASGFNQSKELWLGLEDYLLEAAEAADARLVVVTGPVFEEDDPEYRGILIPLAYWKVAAWVADGALCATAYLLEQRPLLGARAVESGELELGPFRTFQVAVAEVAELTGLELGALPAADRLQPQPGALPQQRRQLESFGDIVL